MSSVARGWHRPVRWQALLWVAGGLVVVWVLLVAGAIWYLYGHWESRVHLQRQALLLRLPAGTVAQAEIRAPIATRLTAHPTLMVPLHQTVRAQVSDQFLARLTTSTTVNIDTKVRVQHQVPVHTTLEARVDLGRWLPTLDVTVPVSLVVPVDMVVPIKTSLPVSLDVLASGQFNAPLSLPLNQVLRLQPVLDAPLEAQLTRQIRFALDRPLPPVPMQIVEARLSVPFDLTFLRQPSR